MSEVNPFLDLANWDTVKSGNVPFERDMLAVIQEAGVEKPEKSTNNFLYFDLYFPKYQANKKASFVMNDKEGSIRIVKSVLETLGIDTSDRSRVLALVEDTKGWQIKVDFYESTSGEKTYQNFRFKGVVDRTPVEGATPFG